MRFSSLSALLLLFLTGCRLWDPTFMPAGYSFHHETYKSPPGPQAPDIGYEYSAEKNEAALNEWRHALRDLLLKARAHDMDLPATLRLTTDLDQNAFQSSYDFILREGLKAYGHTFSNSQDAPILFYSAYDPDSKRKIYPALEWPYNGDIPNGDEDFKRFGPKLQKMELVIGIIQDNKLIRETSGTYELPLYGYAPGAYVQGHENPLKQEKTQFCPLMRCAQKAQMQDEKQ